ncbi:MAG TPA: hypothetical protein VGB18_02485, partial [Candidatus Thermoplasmatota archaeon]
MPGAFVLAALLLLPVGAQASWLQSGYDAARTSATTDAGPAWGDVAFSISLGNASLTNSGPLIHDGHVYVLGLEVTRTDVEGSLWLRATVSRIDLSTAEATPLFSLPERHYDCCYARHYGVKLASDGRDLFALHFDGISAYGLDGTPRWHWDHPVLASEFHSIRCAEPAIQGRIMYVACSPSSGHTGDGDPTDANAFDPSYVAALDLDAHKPRWLRYWDQGNATDAGPVGTIWGFSVVGSRVLLAMETRPLEVALWALDSADGDVEWTLSPEQSMAYVVHGQSYLGDYSASEFASGRCRYYAFNTPP